MIAPNPTRGPKCILVVDDDDAVRGAIAETLELEGYCVECAVKRRERRRERLGNKGRYTKAKTYKLASPPDERSGKPVIAGLADSAKADSAKSAKQS